jgi:hypothetical protein
VKVAQPGDLVRRAGGSRLRRKTGAIVTRYTAPPAGSVGVGLDELGPAGAQSFPGRRLVPVGTEPGARARQEIDSGRRGRGSGFGAFRPATGEAVTVPSAGRTTATWVDCLEQGDVWLPADADPVAALGDTLSPHSAPDVRLFSLAHPRWEFVFQPTDAADLTLIEARSTECRDAAQW